MDWNRITPEYLGRLVNFWLADDDWQYVTSAEDNRMPNKQVEGAAHAFNLISEHRVALIADEVGMGKTIQSLAVCAALWQQKPHARILVLTPREVVAENWISEYTAFIQRHVRRDDAVLRWHGEAVKPAVKVGNLFELVEQVEAQWPRFLVGKITSFSGLIQGERWQERLKAWGREDLVAEWSGDDDRLNGRMASLIRERLMAQGQPPFDLIIIDEAHYLRHFDGGSYRAEAVRCFFGEGVAPPMADGVLLLTATPNHSSNEDVRNVLRYFQPDPGSSKEVLDRLCIRRLRRLGERGANKYEYRHEVADASNFQDDPLAESFFGAYQALLAQQVAEKLEEKGHHSGVSGMIRYLEGVEFLPKPGEQPSEEEDDQENRGSDFYKGFDSGLLQDLGEKFQNIFNESPRHPKYEALLSQLHGLDARDPKALVFVRRIASVYEITRRLMEQVDRSLLGELGLNGNVRDWSRERFVQGSGLELPDEEGDTNDEEDDHIPDSEVLSWFKIKKGDPHSTTPASNFRQLFANSKPGVFAMFFSPAADFMAAPYDDLAIYHAVRSGKRTKRYFQSAAFHRLGEGSEWLAEYRSESEKLERSDQKESGLPTLWTMLISALQEEEPESAALRCYEKMAPEIKESLARFVEKAVLLASADVVWMFQLYRDIKDREGVNGYKAFCDLFEQGFRKRRIWGQIIESILHFETLASKVFELSSNASIFRHNWEEHFRHARPCYPFRGGVGSKHALKCFNTPFYPDVLVATSVLQEGVNLQYFCRRVIHYGAAWTAGDNEQRIGRIDRMFSLVERNLDAGSGELDVRYPVLLGTVDEEHLGRFVKRKRAAERLIDKGAVLASESDSFAHDSGWENWRDFLNRPTADRHAFADPYPVHAAAFNGITAPALLPAQKPFAQRMDVLLNTLTGHPWVQRVLALPGQTPSAFLLDCRLPNGRQQPVQIQFLLDPLATALDQQERSLIRLTSPLGKRDEFKHFQNVGAFSTLGVRIGYDPQREPSSVWGVQAISELPVVDSDFVRVAQSELFACLEHLVKTADDWELRAHQGARDLPLSDVSDGAHAHLPEAQLKLVPGEQKFHPQTWSLRGSQIWKSTPSSPPHDLKRQAIAHLNAPHVQRLQCDDRWYLAVAHPFEDADIEELNVLERHQWNAAQSHDS